MCICGYSVESCGWGSQSPPSGLYSVLFYLSKENYTQCRLDLDVSLWLVNQFDGVFKVSVMKTAPVVLCQSGSGLS